MNGFLKDITYARSGEYILSIYTRESCKKLWEMFGERLIEFQIMKKSEPRGLRANVYEEMLRRYGIGESYIDEAGNECKVVFSLRDGTPPQLVAKHYAEIGVSYLDGKKFVHYRALKGTSEYSSAEMAVFLDGIISECEELEIDVIPLKKKLQTERTYENA